MPLLVITVFLLLLGIGFVIFRQRLPVPATSQALAETFSESLWSIDLQGRITFVNPPTIDLLGYPMSALVGHFALDFVDPAQRRIAQRSWRRLIHGTSQRFDLLLHRQDGSPIWVYISAIPRFDANHKLTHVSGILIDISERKRAEDTLRETETRSRIIWDSTFDALIMHDHGRVLQANRSALTLFGYKLDELVDSDVVELLTAPESWPTAHQAIEVGFEGIYEATLRRKDGSAFIAEIHSRNVNYQGRQVRVVSYHDISERKKIGDALRDLNVELERRVEQRTYEFQRQQIELNAILNAMGEGVFYSEGQFIRLANRALLDITRYTADELIGKRGGILLDRNLTEKSAPPEFLVYMREHAARNANKLFRGETRMVRKDGSTYDAALTFTILTDPNDQIIGSVGVIRDITEDKRLEAQKAAFVANASHELRTPLTNIVTRLYLLRKQPQSLDQHLAVLDKVTERMQHLVADLLDISRFERGVISVHRQDISLQELVQEVVQTQQAEAQQKNIALLADLPLDTVQLFADPDRLTQVIVNLIVNAINYTPTGGKVSVELAIEDDKVAVLRVWDTGVGINAENLAHIFEPFFRVNEATIPGTGLGLSISKAIVEFHGGSLEVESTPQIGSTFIVRLPLSEAVRV